MKFPHHFILFMMMPATFVVSSTGVLSADEHQSTTTKRPNIILVLADDLGWTDLACSGSTYYETPAIDQLAKNGMRFNAFYMSQNCAPTRACILSGQYAPRTGIYSVGTLARGKEQDRKMNVPKNVKDLPLSITTLADVMQKAGYATGMFGKWHLGNQGYHHPSKRGFDEAIVTGGRHFNFSTNPKMNVPAETYLADYLTDLSIDFIERHHQEPFFLYLPHFGVHLPYQAKQELTKSFEQKTGNPRHHDPVYAAMIKSLDESVERITQTLDDLNLTNNTIVIFTSDNGGVGGYDTTEPPSSKRGVTDNKPLRGGKGTLYEGGIRVPMLVQWPAQIAPGSQSSLPFAHVDFLPTFAQLAQTDLPSQTVDGVSFADILMAPPKQIPNREIFWHFPGYLESYVHHRGWRTSPVTVIRTNDYKLMHFHETNEQELYRIAEDLSETENLIDTHPQIAHQLSQRISTWLSSTQAKRATPK